MQVYLVARRQINEVWNQVEKLIIDACEYNSNRCNAEDYRKSLENNDRQLWVAIEKGIKGIAVTEIVDFPQKKCCVIHMFTGDGLDELLAFLPVIEEWAKELGCKQMFAHTRPGLSRKLLSQNYRTTHSVLEKNL